MVTIIDHPNIDLVDGFVKSASHKFISRGKTSAYTCILYISLLYYSL